MSCCDESTARAPGSDVSRRLLFKGAALIASVVPAAHAARAAQGREIKLAYCSQLLCGVPYEVARSAGFFKNHGLDVEIIHSRGGVGAMQALLGGAVDYAATSLDVAIQAYANVGADIRRFMVTGRLPLFAIVTAPKTANEIRSIKDLEGRTVGVGPLGGADHALTLYLLKQAGADARKVRFATVGVNLLEGLRQNQMDAGVVQEPALTVLKRAGAREIERRRPEMIALAAALADALKALRTMTGAQLTAAFPKEMIAGLDLKEFGEIVEGHRDALYPETVNIDLDAARRVEQSLLAGGLIKPGASMSGLHDTTVVGG
jgi:NitT/TauT family transport system substrate-binding protein